MPTQALPPSVQPNNKALGYICGALALLSIAHLAVVYPNLPSRLAIHFAADGTPNGWASKTHFLALQLLLLVLVPGVCALLAVVLPRFPHLLNIPNRSYWLVVPRQPAAAAHVQRFLLQMAGLHTMLFLCVQQLLVTLSAKAKPQIGFAFPIILIAYFIALGFFLAGFYNAFRVPTEAERN